MLRMGQGTDDRILADAVVSTEVMLLYSAKKKCLKIPAKPSIPRSLHGAFKDVTAFRQRLKLYYDQLQVPKAAQKQSLTFITSVSDAVNMLFKKI